MIPKVVAYTAQFDGRDKMFPPIESDVPLVLFTDGADHPGYDTCPHFSVPGLSPRQTSRRLKCLPHLYLPDHDYSIWFDGAFIPAGTLSSLVTELGTGPIGAYPHRFRRSVEEMRDYVSEHRMEYPYKLYRQVASYLTEGMPPKLPTFETGIVVRRNCPAANALNEAWWEEIRSRSERDQISLPYCAWKAGLTVTPLRSGNVWTNPYFHTVGHLKSPPKPKLPVRFL